MATMDWVPDRIRSARKRAKLRQQDLARLCGVSRPAVSQWESVGDNRITPTTENLHKIAEATGVTVSWLLGDEGENVSREEPVVETVTVRMKQTPGTRGGLEDAPSVDKDRSLAEELARDYVPLAAGPEFEAHKAALHQLQNLGAIAPHDPYEKGHSLDLEGVLDDMYRFGVEIKSRRSLVHVDADPARFEQAGDDPRKIFVFTVTGDEMAPEVRTGDIVLVRHSSGEVDNGHVHAVHYSGHFRLKRVFRLLDGSFVLRSGVNNDAPDETVGPAAPPEQFSILGRVIWRGGPL